MQRQATKNRSDLDLITWLHLPTALKANDIFHADLGRNAEDGLSLPKVSSGTFKDGVLLFLVSKLCRFF